MASSIQCVTGATRVLRLLSVASNLNKTNCCNAKKSINATIAFPLQAEGSTPTSKPLAFGFISNGKKYKNYYILSKKKSIYTFISLKSLLVDICLFWALINKKGILSLVPNFGHSTILTSRLITGSKTNYRHFSSLQKANSSYKSTMFTDQVSLLKINNL